VLKLIIFSTIMNIGEYIPLPFPSPSHIEARKRGGKGNKKRRRGGNGLR